MSNAAQDASGSSRRTSALADDLTAEQLASAPTLSSLDSLVIDDLTDEEYDAFLAALEA
jgi:hypothetical protein